MNTTNTTFNSRKMTNPLLAGMDRGSNNALTANGAKSNASSLDACVDFFGKGAAMRAATDGQVEELFSKAFYQDRLVSMRTLFYTRDIREGQGERKTFRTIIRWLAKNNPDVLQKNLALIPVYGRWDDLYELVGTSLEADAFGLIASQLEQDVANAINNKPVSLLAKWLKSVNTSSSESRALGFATAKALELTPKKYRQMLAALRKHIDVLEVKLSAGKFADIDYEKVPSRASLIYRKAFNKRDGERYKQYLSAVEKGEAKINAAALYPYDIIRPIEQGTASGTELRTLDAQWNAQPDYLKDNPHKGLVVCDTSGSMSGMPILVSVSLAIYFAERNKGPFQNAFLTFSKDPKLQYITGKTIAEKVRGLNRGGWDMNTDLQAAFDLILSTAIKSKVPEADMPTTLYIISDMQFDAATGCNTTTNFDAIRRKYTMAGYELPKIVFWNVNASSDSPVTIYDNGTCLVSGCSPSILKSVLSAKTFTPIDIMLETVNKPRYEAVKV